MMDKISTPNAAFQISMFPILKFFPTMKTKAKKRQNSDKRKQRSRDAARCRRAREAEIFNEACSYLPLPENSCAQLDKTSVMRLALSFLRIRNVLQTIEKPFGFKFEELYLQPSATDCLQALDGFIMITTMDGEMIYLSENASNYLGLSHIDLMGNSIYDFSHPYDHEELRELFNKDIDLDDPVFLRFKCTLTNKEKNVNIKSAVWKVINCRCHELEHIRIKTESADDSLLNLSSANQDWLIFLSCAIPHPSYIDTPIGSLSFLTQHSMDFTFAYVDDNMSNILGYEPEDLLRTSLFNYHHAADSEVIEKLYKELIIKGQIAIDLYRFLAKESGYLWLKTEATVICNSRTQRPSCIVCLHHILSGIMEENCVFSMSQMACRTDIDASAACCNLSVDIKSEPAGSVESMSNDSDSVISDEGERFKRNMGENKPGTYPQGVEGLLKLAPEAGDACIPLALPPSSSIGKLTMFDELIDSAFNSPAIFVDNESLWRDITPEEENDEWVDDFFNNI